MFEFVSGIIGTQPILTVFLAIGLGYLVGQINIGGFSLGVGAVLFVGLTLGAFAPKAQITGPIGLTGLVMFLYCIGILTADSFSKVWPVSRAANTTYLLASPYSLRLWSRWAWARY